MTITDIIYYIAAIGAIVSLFFWARGELKSKRAREEKIKEEIRRELFSDDARDNDDVVHDDALLDYGDNIISTHDDATEYNSDDHSVNNNERDD